MISFKKMIQSSCRVEPCSTRHEIDLPKNKDKFFFPFKEQPFVSVFSHQESFANDEMTKGLITSQTNSRTSIYKHWLIKKVQEKHFKFLIHCQR
ncbi:ycf2 protein [Nymphaea thermarum]|nr:ycf2 protein [Nymphaea thermarum]